jgi:superfamily I DNA/RNA helicase
MTNLQHRNVGNVGDILKHAALIALADVLEVASAKEAPIYLDTHAFQYSASLPDAARWNRKLESLLGDFPAYRRYAVSHRDLPAGEVFCSPGLVAEALGTARLVLFELDDSTRANLLAALREHGRSPEFLGRDFLDGNLQLLPSKAGPLLALMDPFSQTEAEYRAIWDQSCHIVTRLHRSGSPCVLEAYQWRRRGERPRWPTAPLGLVGPVATISDEHHHLAVYSTEPEIPACHAALGPLGWNVRPMNTAVRARNDVGHGLTKGIRAFDGYLMADYSGAFSEASQRKAIALCQIEASADAIPHVDGGFTRATLRARLIDLLAAASDAGQRLLVGLDHQFAWPSGLLELCGLSDLSWRGALGSLASGKYGGPRLSHPRTFCNDFNAWCRSTGFSPPYYSPTELYGLPRAPAGRGADHLRSVEAQLQALGHRPSPATLIGTNGAVAGQTITGMVELLELLEQARAKAIRLAVWPFDGFDLNDATYAGCHVIVEIYPTLFRAGVTSDVGDALQSALAFKSADDRGELSSLLCLELDEAGAALVRREGWIAGVRSPPSRFSPSLLVDSLAASMARVPTSEQQQVIDCTGQVVRVLARAGTGKTWTLVRRAAQVVDLEPAAWVCLLTFTRSAADKMGADFAALRPGNERLEANTFHGLAWRCLSSFGRVIDLGDDLRFDLGRVRLLNELDRSHVMSYFSGSGGDLDFSSSWEDDLSQAVNARDPGDSTPLTLLRSTDSASCALPATIERQWSGVLRLYARENLLDFDVVMVLFEYLLRTDPTFLAHARGKVTHYFLDEFQDTNFPQLRAVQSLAGYGCLGIERARQLLAIGDDFQTIYGWRGAVPNVFGALVELASARGVPVHTLGLHVSWRSSPEVLEAVNPVALKLSGLAEHSETSTLVHPELRSRPEPTTGGVLHLVNGPTALEDGVSFLQSQGFSAGDMAVLSYTNRSAAAAASRLGRLGLPAIAAASRAVDQPGFCRFMLLLEAWMRQDIDSLPLAWGLASEFAKVAAPDFEAIWLDDGIRARLPSLLVAMLGDAGLLLSQAKAAVSPGRLGPGDLDRLLEVFAKDTTIASEHEHCARVIRALESRLTQAAEPLHVLGELTRKDFAGTLEQRTSAWASTIHQFKGLESEAVILVYDFTEDRLGSAGEYRRLEYVGRSRARRWLLTVGARDCT